MGYYQVLEVVLEREASGVTDVIVQPANGNRRMLSLEEAISSIKCGHEFFTVDDDGSRTSVFIVSGSQRGTFIRSAPNKSTSDNLLSLKRYRKK
jgi:hypothetical protein